MVLATFDGIFTHGPICQKSSCVFLYAVDSNMRKEFVFLDIFDQNAVNLAHISQANQFAMFVRDNTFQLRLELGIGQFRNPLEIRRKAVGLCQLSLQSRHNLALDGEWGEGDCEVFQALC